MRRAKGELQSPVMLRSRGRPFPGQGRQRTFQGHSTCVGAFLGHFPPDQDHPDPHDTEAFVEPNSVRKTKTGKGNTKEVSMHLLRRRVVNDNSCTRTEEHGCLLKHEEPPTPGENVVTPRTLFWPIT